MQKMETRRKSIDLVACKDGKKIAFEIETGKNTVYQVIENMRKCLNGDFDKIYFIATNDYAYKKIKKLLNENNIDDARLYLVRVGK